MKRLCTTVFLIAMVMLGSSLFGAYGRRVLVVTTEQNIPMMYQENNGEYVITDLAASGYPFDVVTYGRFVGMTFDDLDNHDIIILNGHTSPTPVSTVAAKCQEAMAAGRKIFINGYRPYMRYNTSGQLVEQINYCTTLFNLTYRSKPVSGVASLPAFIEKDPLITACGFPSYWVNTFSFTTDPPVLIKMSGYNVGFLGSTGGCIDSCGGTYFMSILDYGKVVTYLRYGQPGLVGFSLDRIGGKPVVSFEVHCDSTSDIKAINGLVSLANDMQMPLTNLLVYDYLTSNSISKWNEVSTNQLMLIGSHSKSHPQDWPSVSDFWGQTIGALNSQRIVIPATGNYFNFSGSMNPTIQQIDQLYSSGVVFGGRGFDLRYVKPANTSSNYKIQLIPTVLTWLRNLSQSSTTPFCLSQTVESDHAVWQQGRDYFQEATWAFDTNVKYGLYTYGYIHDYMFDPANPYYYNGTHMSVIERAAFAYMKSKGAYFVDTESLIRRLRDFSNGWIDYDTNPDGSITVSVYRPNSCANQVKIEGRNGLAPVASGDSVLSQTRVGSFVYVDLRPESFSQFDVHWQAIPPDPPVVTAPSFVSNTISVAWSKPVGAYNVAEYQYALGTTPGGNDVIDWTSNGLERSVVISGISLQSGADYYVSVKARSDRGLWSEPGVSSPIRADLTPPTQPQVSASAVFQPSGILAIHANWSSSDLESGISSYRYAVGTSPGQCDVVGWTNVGSMTDILISNPAITQGRTYYVGVIARNNAGLDSEVGVSGGVLTLFVGTIGNAKKCADGSTVQFADVRVTAVFDDCIYVEQPDRSSGIKVQALHSYKEGDSISVSGTIGTADNGERVVVNPQLGAASPMTPLKPFGMANRWIGGSAFGSLTLGVEDGVGLNNVGLLVTTTGRVLYVGDDYFYIDDGSHVASGKPWAGIRVYAPMLTKPAEGDDVSVTGIVSIYRDGDGRYPMIRPRYQKDIRSLRSLNTLILDAPAGIIYAKPSSLIEIALCQTRLEKASAGFQAFLDYDSEVLSTSSSNICATPSPYGLLVYRNVDEDEGEIDYAAGIDQGAMPAQQSVCDPALLATIRCTALREGMARVVFRRHYPETMFTDTDGSFLPTFTVDGPVIIVDGTPPNAAILYPSHGETIQGGTVYEIRWSASDANLDTNSIKLEYFDGASWSSIVEQAYNSGRWFWQVPNTAVSSANIRLTVSDMAGNSSQVESGVFNISPS